MDKHSFTNKRNVILILVCIALVACLIIYKVLSLNDGANPDKNVVSKAQVARAVSLIYHTTEECEQIEDRYKGNSDEWFVPYMNAMYEHEFYLTKDIKPTDADATAVFTYDDLDKLLTNVGVADKEIWSYVKNNKASNPIITKEWNEIYEKLVKLLDVNERVQKKNICIVATASNVPVMTSWHTATTAGELTFTGLAIDYYIDKEVNVLMKDKELLAVLSVESEEITYENAWIITLENGKAKAYVEGAVREFEIKDKNMVYSSVAADITLKKKEVSDININSKSISGKVLSENDEMIELEGQGIFNLDGQVKVYKVYGSMEMKTVNDVLVGYDMQRFILNNEGNICAIAIDRDVNTKDIRVLIRSSNYADIYHETVEFTSESPLELTYGNTNKMTDGGATITITPDSEYLSEGRLVITPTTTNGRIKINSITRAYGAPNYRGSIEIAKMDGKLVVINELSIEQYLYGVVPSEVPYTYSMEALKSQAICARSYAYKHVLSNSLSQYGAHVDDSVAYQVYNNSGEKNSTTQAVDETYGQIMMYGDEIVTAWFFSTSCGSSTDANVWGQSDVPYIKGHILSEQDVNIDLTNEENFDTFIRSNFESVDSTYPLYRWKLNMTLDDITKTVNEKISQLYNSSPNKVLTVKEDGEPESLAISNVGNVKRIALGERDTGGVLKYIVIYGTEATVRVETEYFIRQLFRPVSDGIVLADGSSGINYNMLPSAYFVMDPNIENGVITGYTIIGGGYGHGVGMSQNGANTLGNKGMSCKEILEFFYNDIEVKNAY